MREGIAEALELRHVLGYHTHRAVRHPFSSWRLPFRGCETTPTQPTLQTNPA
nr:MAG TPA: hypothetical protein [Caudoviricetes sp.]